MESIETEKHKEYGNRIQNYFHDYKTKQVLTTMMNGYHLENNK